MFTSLCTVCRPYTLWERRAPVSSSYEHRSRLRSTQNGDLVVPLVKLAEYGQQTFAVAGPLAWNNLSTRLLTLEPFKPGLKAYFFVIVCSLLNLSKHVEMARLNNVAILLLLLLFFVLPLIPFFPRAKN